MYSIWNDIDVLLMVKTAFIKLINWCRTRNGMHNHMKTYDLYFLCSSNWYTLNKLYCFHCLSCWFIWIILYILVFFYIIIYFCKTLPFCIVYVSWCTCVYMLLYVYRYVSVLFCRIFIGIKFFLTKNIRNSA